MKSEYRVALIGNPNSGKSYIFNKITGACLRTANYPGATVDIADQVLYCKNIRIKFFDLPGIYSLNAMSQDEAITVNLLGSERYDLILNVVDSTNLERNLYLTHQLMELGLPVVAVLSKYDLAINSGIKIDVGKLSEITGIEFLIYSEDISDVLCNILGGYKYSPNIKEFSELGYDYLEEICKKVVVKNHLKKVYTDRIDAVLTNRWLGIPIFFFIMYLLFKFTFTLGALPSMLLQHGVDLLTDSIINSSFAINHSILTSLVCDGIIAGVGGVLAFVPNIFFLFVGLSILEESGYISRVAFIMDHLMHKMGLHGKSFISILLGLGCTVPAIMSTRTIENRKDRLTTMFVLPMISCSARLVVYTMLVAIFFPVECRALVLWSLYITNFATTLLVSRFLRKRIFQGESDSFIMEMGPYLKPSWRMVFRTGFDKSCNYIKKIGTFIVGFSILFWVIFNFPFNRSEGELPAINNFTHHLEVLVKLLGFDDKIALALLSSVAGKEVFVAQLGVMYSVERGSGDVLAEILQNNYSPLTAYCVMIFIMFCMPCASTIAVTYRESKSILFTISQLLFLTFIAYIITWSVYRLGLLLL